MADQINHSGERFRLPLLAKAAIGLGLAVVVYAIGWIYVADVAQGSVAAWAGERRAEGFSVRYDDISRSGFPLSITLDIDNPGFGAPSGPAPWGWEGERLSLSVRPWNWKAIRARTWGTQMVAFSAADGLDTFTGSAAMIEAEIGLAKAQVNRLDATVDGLVLRGKGADTGNLAVGNLALHLSHSDGGGADFKTVTAEIDIAASGLILPHVWASPLGDRFRNVELQARMMGALPAGPMTEALETWRDAGGTLEMKRLLIRHGPALLKADGTLALDGALQPIGAFTARLEGFFETVEALQKMGLVKPRDAVAAKMLLGVMARQPDDGGPAVLNMALTVQGQKLYAGPVALLELSPIDWHQFGSID
ncbi:MAG: DUF2125 domain-containing protein [Rhodospirillaceae bacterium]|nr:DUF2125 domain-containing protein [Rhodospirillaceae bacterium]